MHKTTQTGNGKKMTVYVYLILKCRLSLADWCSLKI